MDWKLKFCWTQGQKAAFKSRDAPKLSTLNKNA